MTLAAAGRSQPRCVQLTQRADRVAQPAAIIPPVLELPQATWRQSSRRWLKRRSPVYSKSEAVRANHRNDLPRPSG